MSNLTYPRIRGINNETIGSKQTSAASATAKALLILLFSLISIVQIVHLRLINRFQTFQSFLSDTEVLPQKLFKSGVKNRILGLWVNI